MKVCVFGAGAVGGHVATRLAHAGLADVSVVARGAHLAAMRANGLTLRNNEGESWTAHIAQATDQPETLPPQDVVLVALKSCSLPAQAATIAGLLGEDGVAVFLNNGIPWWWNHGFAGGKNGGGHLPLLDPEGALWNVVGPHRALGAVITSPNEIEAPGVVMHVSKQRNRFIFGGPRETSALQASMVCAVTALFNDSGLPAESSDDLYREIWQKLVLNASGNTVSALTRLGTAQRAHEPGVQQVIRCLATEVAQVAEAMGWPIAPQAIDDALSFGRAQNMRPSMLQDVLLGRPLETQALLGQPHLFAREYGVATPYMDVVVALLRGLERSQAPG